MDFTPATRRAWDHYQECRAVGWNVADAADPLVRHHAALIRAVEDAVESRRAGTLAAVMALALKGKTARG